MDIPKLPEDLIKDDELKSEDIVLICLVYHGLKPAAEFSVSSTHADKLVYEFMKLGIESAVVPDIPPFLLSIVFSKKKNIIEQYKLHRFNHSELGKIFGFPREDTQVYLGNMQDGLRNIAFTAKVIELYEKGEIIPWVPFIFHIPASINIPDKDSTAKRLAVKYYHFIRQNYPELCDTFIKEYYESAKIKYAALCNTKIVECRH